jgi:hypothetical protein
LKGSLFKKSPLLSLLFVGICLISFTVRAGENNFEIIVHPSETVETGHAELVLHSNMAVSGTTQKTDGVLPTQHALNESLEVAYGFTSWFETAVYSAVSVQPGMDGRWVGERIFPRIRAPESWGLPVGIGFGTIITCQQRAFSADTRSMEIIPIVDKRWGGWYFSINPAVGRSLKGENTGRGWEFSPAFKGSYDITRRVAVGIEYYSSLGPIRAFDPVGEQQHTLFSAVDVNLGAEWELNFGAGVGLTGASDALVLKMILGRRF